jgi:membrane-bound lytic murein transglycosylase B
MPDRLPTPSLAGAIAANSASARSSGAHPHVPLMPPLPHSRPRRARALRVALALSLTTAIVVTAAPARAASRAPRLEAPNAPTTPLAPPSPDLPGLPGTSIELAQVPVGGAEFERAAAAYRDVDVELSHAQSARRDLDVTTSTLTARVRELEAVRASSTARIAGLRARLGAVERAIQELAVDSFVSGDEDDRINEAVSSENPATNVAERRDVYAGLTMDMLLSERAAYLARVDVATERADAAVTELTKARKLLEAGAKERPDAVHDEVVRAKAVAGERVAYEEARVLAQVEGVEFPLVALDAYYRAATTVAEERPGCRVEWWGLAGISRVEGRHGTYGGTHLKTNGDTAKRIIGIQLNGTNSTAVVRDTDDGRLDGDPSYDRAVGPMQFIPQTWHRFEADGNEDGTQSPFNLYDAALAAADYLCTASSGLDADPGLRSAYFSYNHSLLYVDSVLGYARLYERAVEVPDRTS